MRSEGWRCDLAGGDAICACDLTGRREGVVEKLIFREALQLRVAVHFGMAYQAQQHALRTPCAGLPAAHPIPTRTRTLAQSRATYRLEQQEPQEHEVLLLWDGADRWALCRRTMWAMR